MKKSHHIAFESASSTASEPAPIFKRTTSRKRDSKLLAVASRSALARERFADSLMTLANIIHGAALISVLVFPLTAFISALYNVADPFSFLAPINQFTWERIALFVMAYLTPLLIGVWARIKAMDIYDEIAES